MQPTGSATTCSACDYEIGEDEHRAHHDGLAICTACELFDKPANTTALPHDQGVLAVPILAIGQIWTCKDPRRAGRTVKITAFDHERVYATVVTNTHMVQALVDSGRKKLDRCGRRTTILTRRFSADCYQLIGKAPFASGSTVARLTQTCLDYGHHRWTPLSIIGPMNRPGLVRLVCAHCHAHTYRQSVFVPTPTLPGDLAA
ncbi:hypothetical protein AB0H73_05955 [Streptomyces olivoreticuli]